MIRRCTQCGTASDDIYGFCYKCGHEFPKIESKENSCPLCGFQNPQEADYCVKCGTPLVLKNQIRGENNSPIIIRKEFSNQKNDYKGNGTNRLLIIFGYIFSILGGILGLIIAIYLSTRKDPVARKHGHIQLAIFAFYIILIASLYATGNIPADAMTQYRQLLSGNITSI